MSEPTILDEMKGSPPSSRDEVMDELIELASQRITMMSASELAQAGAHEYDEEIVVPEPGTPGEVFLRATARALLAWVRLHGRFPQSGDDERDAAGDWLAETEGSHIARAYVDLGLFYSAHAAAAEGAEVQHLRAVLQEVAEQAVVTLTEDFGPIV